MKDTKRQYETTIIVNASLDDSFIEGVIAKVQDVIIKNQGEVVAVQRWGRKRLAYPIGKKNNGFYVCLEFRGPGDIVTKLSRFYHLEENILRYLTIQLTKQSLKARLAAPAPEGIKVEVSTAPGEQEKPPSAVQESDIKPS